MILRSLAVPSGESVTRVLSDLADVLAGSGEAVLPLPGDDPLESARLVEALSPGGEIDSDVALVVATSGTTGIPKGAMLTAQNIASSVSSSLDRLGGPGQWVLALPAHHIAGLGVLFRSIAADTEPVCLDVSGGFSVDAFILGSSKLTHSRRYTSLVPNQLLKLLDADGGANVLREFDAVLVGGAATAASLVERCAAEDIRLVRSYGMSETCGGCVYDHIPLDGTRIAIEDNRVLIGGPTVAKGYRNLEHSAFNTAGWFRTSDLGSFDGDRLVIIGRADAAITSGALTVVPDVVSAALSATRSVAECVVVGVPDERLGEAVAAAVVARAGHTIDVAALQRSVKEQLGGYAVPREIVIVDELPRLKSGKPDLAEVRRMIEMRRSTNGFRIPTGNSRAMD